MSMARHSLQRLFAFVAALAGFASAASLQGAAPVLVLTDGGAENQFGNYFAEIMRGEGLLAFEQRERTSLTAANQSPLSSYQAIVLAEMSLSPAEETLLRDYVAGGGTLIGAQPDTGLIGRLRH